MQALPTLHRVITKNTHISSEITGEDKTYDIRHGNKIFSNFGEQILSQDEIYLFRIREI